MVSSDLVVGTMFLFQISFGFAGNALLFTLYTSTSLSPHKKKTVDVILAHLTLANALTLAFRGIPNTMKPFGIRPRMGDVGCKFVLYIQRVTRGISLCTTSLQSTFQAVTITPSEYKWAWLKTRISAFIQPCLFLFWVINMVIYTEVILKNVENMMNTTEDKVGYFTPYCKAINIDYQSVIATQCVLFFRDCFFLFIMIYNSLYMLYILFKHHRAVQTIRSTSRSSQSSPESKATHIILALVSCFVFFYCVNTFLTVYTIFEEKQRQQLQVFNDFVSSCYPAVCPFILVKNENRIPRLNAIKTRIRATS